MNALMLSAGLGTRFRPATDHIAKPAIPFLNVPLLGYSLFYLEKLGLKNLVLNTHHLPKTVEASAECLTHKKNYTVQFSYEPNILGSGGGIKQAQSLLNSTHDFVVCNADEVILFNHDSGFSPLLEFHKSQNALATLLTTQHPQAGISLGGVWADSVGKITQLGGQSLAPGAHHFTGVYIFSPRIFDYMPSGGEFHIFKDCLHKAMANGEKVLSFYDPDLTWLDMSSERDYISATQSALSLLASGATDSSVHAGCARTLIKILSHFQQNFTEKSVRQWLCPNAKFSGSLSESSFLLMGPDSEIGKDVEVRGFAILGTQAKFHQGVIQNSVIAHGVHINALTSLRNELVL